MQLKCCPEHGVVSSGHSCPETVLDYVNNLILHNCCVLLSNTLYDIWKFVQMEFVSYMALLYQTAFSLVCGLLEK